MTNGLRSRGLAKVIIFVCVTINPFFHGTYLKFARESLLRR